MNYSGEGIMAQINSLVAPPQVNSSGGGKKDSSAAKKSGRSHKDVCFACGDGGDMLSCSSCSTTMHSLCSDPPIDEEETRPVRWKCRSCVNSQKESLPMQGNARKGAKGKAGRKAAQKIDPSNVVMSAPDPPKKVALATESVGNFGTSIGNTFEQVIREVKKLNPMEFSLPSDYPTHDHQFPGSSRQLYKKSSGSKPKPLVVVEADIATSLKSKVYCFSCNQSCRLKPLIKCDFCSAYYHFDCLNPPLITAPIGIWQCPLHVEPFLESTTLQTTKLSERVRLWERTKEPVNQTSVILKFFRKTFNPNPLFHHKIEMNREKTAHVPEFVVDLYDSNMYNSDDEIGSSDISLQQRSHSKKFIEVDNLMESSESPIETTSSSEHYGRAKPKSKVSESPLEILAKTALEMENQMDALKGMDLNTIKELAARKLFEIRMAEQFLKKQEASHIENPKITEKPTEKNFLYTSFIKMRPVISLVCVNTMKKVTIRSKSVSIGTGDSATINLAKMSDCKGVSVRHANIAYDILQCRWELVNYSPHGTVVDDCLLGCDFTPELREPSKYADLPELSLKKYLLDRNKTAVKACTKQYPASPLHDCRCFISGLPSLRSWEGPIPLKPKSRIQIGCLVFLVITVDHVEDEVRVPIFKPPLIERHEKKVKLDNALIQCLPPRPKDESNQGKTLKLATSEVIKSPAHKSTKSDTVGQTSKVPVKKGSLEINVKGSIKSSSEVAKGIEPNPPTVEPVASKQIEDKSSVEEVNKNIEKKTKFKMKTKREVSISGHCVSHPYAQPRAVQPLATLVPAKLSPKKLVNYFDTKVAPKKSDETSVGKTDAELVPPEKKDPPGTECVERAQESRLELNVEREKQSSSLKKISDKTPPPLKKLLTQFPARFYEHEIQNPPKKPPETSSKATLTTEEERKEQEIKNEITRLYKARLALDKIEKEGKINEEMKEGWRRWNPEIEGDEESTKTSGVKEKETKPNTETSKIQEKIAPKAKPNLISIRVNDLAEMREEVRKKLAISTSKGERPAITVEHSGRRLATSSSATLKQVSVTAVGVPKTPVSATSTGSLKANVKNIDYHKTSTDESPKGASSPPKTPTKSATSIPTKFGPVFKP